MNNERLNEILAICERKSENLIQVWYEHMQHLSK